MRSDVRAALDAMGVARKTLDVAEAAHRRHGSLRNLNAVEAARDAHARAKSKFNAALAAPSSTRTPPMKSNPKLATVAAGLKKAIRSGSRDQRIAAVNAARGMISREPLSDEEKDTLADACKILEKLIGGPDDEADDERDDEKESEAMRQAMGMPRTDVPRPHRAAGNVAVFPTLTPEEARAEARRRAKR